MIRIKTDFPNEKAKQDYIADSEQQYKNSLDNVANALLADDRLQLITVSGPTCSGKTTTSEKLLTRMEKAGKALYLVSLDNFYKNRSELPILPDGSLDRDTVASLDLPCLSHCVEKLIKEEPVDLPVFDFTKGKRSGYIPYIPQKDDIVIFEGIQAIYPEIRGMFPNDITASVAIMPMNDAAADDIKFSPREIRLLRRLVRDQKMRKNNAEETLSMWRGVCENENRSILPYIMSSDYCIDSFFPYELSVLRPLAESVLHKLPPTSAYQRFSDNLLYRLSKFPVISTDYVPQDSMLREFIGC